MFSRIHLDLENDGEVILNCKIISHIYKKEEEGKTWVSICDRQGETISAIEGDLARSFWEEEVRRASATFNGQPEYWEADITQLTRNQLLALIEAINLIEQWGDDADYQDEDIFPDHLLKRIPVGLLNHISSIARPGRFKFLASIAESLYYSSLIQSQLALVDPTPTQIIEANS